MAVAPTCAQKFAVSEAADAARAAADAARDARIAALEAAGTPGPTPTPSPTVTFVNAAYSAQESGNLVFTVARSTTSGAATFPWAIQFNGTANSSDLASGQATSGSVTIPNGQLGASFTIALNHDTDVEPDDNFTVLLSTATGYVAGPYMSATGTILNDDAAPTAAFISAASDNQPAGVTRPRQVRANMPGTFALTGGNAPTIDPVTGIYTPSTSAAAGTTQTWTEEFTPANGSAKITRTFTQTFTNAITAPVAVGINLVSTYDGTANTPLNAVAGESVFGLKGAAATSNNGLKINGSGAVSGGENNNVYIGKDAGQSLKGARFVVSGRTTSAGQFDASIQFALFADSAAGTGLNVRLTPNFSGFFIQLDRVTATSQDAITGITDLNMAPALGQDFDVIITSTSDANGSYLFFQVVLKNADGSTTSSYNAGRTIPSDFVYGSKVGINESTSALVTNFATAKAVGSIKVSWAQQYSATNEARFEIDYDGVTLENIQHRPQGSSLPWRTGKVTIDATAKKAVYIASAATLGEQTPEFRLAQDTAAVATAKWSTTFGATGAFTPPSRGAQGTMARYGEPVQPMNDLALYATLINTNGVENNATSGQILFARSGSTGDHEIRNVFATLTGYIDGVTVKSTNATTGVHVVTIANSTADARGVAWSGTQPDITQVTILPVGQSLAVKPEWVARQTAPVMRCLDQLGANHVTPISTNTGQPEGGVKKYYLSTPNDWRRERPYELAINLARQMNALLAAYPGQRGIFHVPIPLDWDDATVKSRFRIWHDNIDANCDFVPEFSNETVGYSDGVARGAIQQAIMQGIQRGFLPAPYNSPVAAANVFRAGFGDGIGASPALNSGDCIGYTLTGSSFQYFRAKQAVPAGSTIADNNTYFAGVEFPPNGSTLYEMREGNGTKSAPPMTTGQFVLWNHYGVGLDVYRAKQNVAAGSDLTIGANFDRIGDLDTILAIKNRYHRTRHKEVLAAIKTELGATAYDARIKPYLGGATGGGAAQFAVHQADAEYFSMIRYGGSDGYLAFDLTGGAGSSYTASQVADQLIAGIPIREKQAADVAKFFIDNGIKVLRYEGGPHPADYIGAGAQYVAASNAMRADATLAYKVQYANDHALAQLPGLTIQFLSISGVWGLYQDMTGPLNSPRRNANDTAYAEAATYYA